VGGSFYAGTGTDLLEQTMYKNGASHEVIFPKFWKGCWDKDVLERIGLTEERIQKHDALFFYQLLLPICNSK
jgi:hypothetical protein